MNADARPVLIMAGGTGGHVYPALAVARALLAQRVPVLWLGTRSGLEGRVVPAAGIPIEWLSISGLRGKGLLALFVPFKLLFACLQAARIILRTRPRIVLGMGGYVAAPGGLACKLLMKPLVIHEQNAVAGFTNRLLSKLANSVLQAFPNTFKPELNAYHTGNPVREDIANIPLPDLRLAERKGRLRVLVIGGSQGSSFLNEIMPRAIATMPSSAWPQVRHQAGQGHLQATQQSYKSKDIDAEVTTFIDDMAAAYAWADIAVCRSGAMTVAELAAAGLPSILVPFPHAVDDHQTRNARFLADKGAAILAPQPTLRAETLGDWLSELGVDRRRLLRMAQSARTLARLDATRLVVRECLAVAESY
ncbi:MAG TPA: undecaprenyldiphospho-muramoylpentapeptide beta-N-acetylglucosaminyltransferase [Gammaproteobacteria bacterium]